MDEQKSVFRSKTIHFNWLSGVIVHAVWPFLPKHFREQPYAMSAITSWFALGNIALRFVTTEAVSLFHRRDNGDKQDKV